MNSNDSASEFVNEVVKISSDVVIECKKLLTMTDRDISNFIASSRFIPALYLAENLLSNAIEGLLLGNSSNAESKRSLALVCAIAAKMGLEPNPDTESLQTFVEGYARAISELYEGPDRRSVLQVKTFFEKLVTMGSEEAYQIIAMCCPDSG